MFPQLDNPRKRALEPDEVAGLATGFSEHRAKRQMASLPHRGSPRHAYQGLDPPSSLSPPQPAPPTITPADSDEETLAASELNSHFSPFPSSPTESLFSSPTSYHQISSTEATHGTDRTSSAYSEDYEMIDSIHLSPGSFHREPSNIILNRIPTPIHSSFIRDIRQEKAHRHSDPDFADDESIVDRVRRGRRPPSPISENEMSPSLIAEELEQMEVDVEHERATPSKKGHSRSKYSLRSWTNIAEESGNSGSGVKRSFTMGYRSDCEKCRNKVEGHFIHVIVR